MFTLYQIVVHAHAIPYTSSHLPVILLTFSCLRNIFTSAHVHAIPYICSCQILLYIYVHVLAIP